MGILQKTDWIQCKSKKHSSKTYYMPKFKIFPWLIIHEDLFYKSSFGNASIGMYPTLEDAKIAAIQDVLNDIQQFGNEMYLDFKFEAFESQKISKYDNAEKCIDKILKKFVLKFEHYNKIPKPQQIQK